MHFTSLPLNREEINILPTAVVGCSPSVTVDILELHRRMGLYPSTLWSLFSLFQWLCTCCIISALESRT